MQSIGTHTPQHCSVLSSAEARRRILSYRRKAAKRVRTPAMVCRLARCQQSAVMSAQASPRQDEAIPPKRNTPYFRDSISVARRLHSSCSERVGTDRPARWYHPPAFLMSPSCRCRCACTQSQSGSPSCCWTHSCARSQSPRSAHQSACKAGPTSGGGIVADTLLRNASIVVMIAWTLCL